MNYKCTLLSAACVLLLQHAEPLHAQPSSKSSPVNVSKVLDSLLYSPVNGFAGNKSVVGAAVGVFWKGHTYYRCYGWADRERKLKADTTTLFEIGSNSKVFTALMLSSEMAAGTLSGNEFINRYVDVHKNLADKVRLVDLANHMSGLPTFHDSASLAALIARDTSKDPLMLLDDDYALSTLRRTDTLHNYGRYEYSNLGVGLLGYILQKKNGKTYEQLLQQMICRPLGLKHTTSLTDTSDRKLARGYSRGERAPFIDLCSFMQGAGAIKSDVVDMMSFVRSQLHGNAALQEALAISHRRFYKGEEMQVAMGWHITEMYGAETWEMRGDTYGASSLMMFNSKDDLGIVILMNSANSRGVNRARSALLANFLDTSGILNRYALPEIKVSTDILQAYAGKYELQADVDATISVEEGQLAIQLTDQPKITFKAVDENWFVMEKLGCQLEFVRNALGKCDEMNLYQHGQKVTCKRR